MRGRPFSLAAEENRDCCSQDDIRPGQDGAGQSKTGQIRTKQTSRAGGSQRQTTEVGDRSTESDGKVTGADNPSLKRKENIQYRRLFRAVSHFEPVII